MRRAGNRDRVERDIVAALRACGRHVTLLSAAVDGVPDALVTWPGGFALLEFKSPGGKLSPAQMAWHRAYNGPPGTLHVVRTLDEALAATGLRR